MNHCCSDAPPSERQACLRQSMRLPRGRFGCALFARSRLALSHEWLREMQRIVDDRQLQSQSRPRDGLGECTTCALSTDRLGESPSIGTRCALPGEMSRLFGSTCSFRVGWYRGNLSKSCSNNAPRCQRGLQCIRCPTRSPGYSPADVGAF